MKKFKRLLFACIFGLLLNSIYSQVFYIKEIMDSTKAGIFGQVAFMDQDSLNLYLVTNTTYSSGYCSGTTGLNYVIKINKQTGAILGSNSITGNPLATKITAGFKLNNALYLGGEMSNLTTRYAVLAKYNLITNQIEWSLPLSALNTPMNYISAMKFNSNKSNLVFTGVDSYSISPSAYIGFIDTIGNLFGNINFGLIPSGGQLTNPKFDFSTVDSKFYTIANDFNTDSIYIVKNLNWSVFGQVKKINLKSDGNQYSVSFNKYILNIVNYNNSFTCFIMDTAYNIIKSKKFSNVYFKSVGVEKEKAVLTAVNYFGPGKGNQIINIKIDSALNVLSAKKVLTDTFGVSSLTSSTIFNKASDGFFNLISKQFAYGKSIMLYKSNFANLYCNEISYTPTVSIVSVTGTLAAASCTGGVGTATPALIASPKGFIDSLICNAFQGINEFSDYKTSISIYPNPVSSFITVEFQNEFEQPLTTRITDLSGRELSKFSLEKSKQSLDVRNLSQGLYLINFYSEKGSFIGSSKFIKSD